MIAVIIQARMGSTRLPGKVMKLILGKPALERLIERVKRARRVDKIIIATTSKKSEDAIIKLAGRLKIPVFRGSEDDVLDRYYKAAKFYGIEDIVRITGDCPLMDPAVVDRVAGFYLRQKNRYDYVSNVHPPTFPDGMDVEVFSLEVLEKAWKKARLPSEREHVTPYIRKRPKTFRLGNISSSVLFPQLRLTLDNPEDLILIRKVFTYLYPRKHYFTLADMLELFQKRPELRLINAHIIRNEGLIKSLRRDKFSRFKEVKPQMSGHSKNNNLRLEGEGIFLRPVDLSDATEEYVSWLNDKEVNQFLEARFTRHTSASLRTYIGKVIKDPNILFWAIVRKDTERHIGNIKLGPIDRNHKVGDIGIMIGDKNSWGKGFATEAIRLISDYAFKTLKLHKLTAGAYANNIGSIQAFLKLGFFEEGRRKKHVLCDGKYLDVTLLAKLNEN